MADFITQFTAEEYVNRDNFNSRITQANTGLATVQSAAAAAQQTANGKAPVSHTHAAVDITSGTLPIARGGTGQTTTAGIRNALGLGNTTGAVPIANGGTGATTAAVARTALGITPANIGAGTQSAVEAAQTTADNAASAAAAAQQTANGKAPTSHTHAAVDIASGTLPIARGGTGQTTVAGVRNALGLGNTTGALPIANGGTGATTAAAARTALEITPANLGAVPTTRTINGKALSNDVMLTASDVGAMAYDLTIDTSNLNVLDWARTQTKSISVNFSNTATGFPFTAYWRIELTVIGTWKVLRSTNINWAGGQYTNVSYDSGASWVGWTGSAALDSFGLVAPLQSYSKVIYVNSNLTITPDHLGRFIYCYGTNIVITIPDDNTSIPVGAEFEVFRGDASYSVNITTQANVGLYSPSSTGSKYISEAYSVVAVKKLGANTWLLSGSLE